MALSAELLAKLKQSKNKLAARTGGKTVKLKEGKTIVRILQKGDELFYTEYGVHWIKASKDGKIEAVVGCHADTYGKPCPIDEAIAHAAAAASDDKELELIKSWKSRKSVIFNALVRTVVDGKFKDELVILELTGGTAADLFGKIEEFMEQGVDALDPKTGIDWTMERTGRGQNDTKYSITPRMKSHPVPVEFYDKLVDLNEYVEKEFFRGEEPKALTAIAAITGSTSGLTALTGGSKPAALTHSPAAIVEDADEAAEIAEVAEIAEEVVDAEEEVVDEEAELMAKLEAARKAKAAAAAKAAAKPAAAKPAAAKAAPAAKIATPTAAEAEDIDAMLADLEK